MDPPTSACFSTHQRFDPGVDRRQRGDHAPAAAPDDQQVDGLVPRHHAGIRSVSPRSAIGTSIVVFVFWIAGTSRSYGSPARKPSTTRSKFEISPSTSIRQPHELKALGVQSLLLLRQVREVLGGNRRASSGRRAPAARAAVGLPCDSSSGKRVSDQISKSVSSGPSGRIRYDDALLYCGRRK